MPEKSVVLVARDVAPSKALALFEEAIRKEMPNVEVFSFLGHGQPIKATPAEIIEKSMSAFPVVCGMSSTAELAQLEILAANTAINNCADVIFYADNNGAVGRPWFQVLLDYPHTTLFCPNVLAAKKAKEKRAFLDVVVVGNPLHEQYGLPPQKTKAKICEQFDISHAYKIVLVSLTKSVPINLELGNSLLTAVQQMTPSHRRNMMIWFSTHPGDENPVQMYHDRLSADEVNYKIFTKSQAESSLLLLGADLVLVSNPEASLAIEAFYRRIPVIHYGNALILEHYQQQTGQLDWPKFEAGEGIQVLDSPMELWMVLEDLLFVRGTKDIRLKQEVAYPAPPPMGTAVGKMVEFLKTL